MELKEMKARIEKIEKLQADAREIEGFIDRLKNFDSNSEQLCIIKNGSYTIYKKTGKVVDIISGNSGITAKAHLLQVAEITLAGLLKEIEELQK